MKYFLLPSLILFSCVLKLHPAYADSKSVLDIPVSASQVITQEIKITPGFAAIIELPSEIVSMAIADQNSFSCSAMPPEKNKVICKPLVASVGFSTNLILATDQNEFNLILIVDGVGKNNYFKYVFHDGLIAKGKLGNQQTASMDSGLPAEHQHKENSNLMENLLSDFESQKCAGRVENTYAVLKCVERVDIGTESYLKFNISSKYRSPLTIVRCVISIQSLGGFTGLTLKSETPTPTDYTLKSHDLRFGEMTDGVVKLPKISVGQDQRMVLTLYTDIGKDADLSLRI